MTAWIILAHGSREPRARESLERLVARLADKAPECTVVPAYFSLGEPDLSAQAAALVARGATRIHVFPLFLLDGVHVRRDIPALLENLRAFYPQVDFVLEPSLQDDPGLIDVLARRLAPGSFPAR